MTLLETIIFFLVVWWPIFFIILPIGYQQLPQENEFKFARSSPKNPKLILKFSFTTVFSIIITATFWFLSYFKIFSLKSLII